MTQPVESFEWVYTMKISLNLEVKIDLTKVIVAITGFCVAIENIIPYFY